MRILIVGATGTIGQPLVAALQGRHELVLASRQKAHEQVDISNPDSIKSLYGRIGRLDAVVSVAGDAKFAPLASLSDEDFAFSIRNKLMGQVNLVRYGFDAVRDGGSFTITSGVLAQTPMVGSGAVSLVNAGLEGFARAAALEAPRGDSREHRQSAVGDGDADRVQDGSGGRHTGGRGRAGLRLEHRGQAVGRGDLAGRGELRVSRA